jgi:DNA-directed RNA polymerase I, II, and III subunit RPABC2
MSDDEHYSDSDSENNNSDNEEIDVPSNKKIIFKPSSAIKSFSKFDSNNLEGEIEEDDSEMDDADIEDEEEEEQEGGAVSEEGEVLEEEDSSDTESDNSDIELDENGEPIEDNKNNKNNKTSKTLKNKKTEFILQDDEDDDDEYDENYLQKFDNEIIKNYVNEFHPECLNHNYDEISHLSVVTKNSNGIIIDPLHKTIPYLTKYEKARILGQRSKQIENGAKPLVKVPENIVEAYIIAELELKEKKIPFIIRRPIPGGGCEYWKLKDLEIISF